jgi:hypothetical protein
MSALDLMGPPRTILASTRMWEDQNSPGDQGFKQRLLQNQFAPLSEVYVVVTRPHPQQVGMSNFTSDIVQWAQTNAVTTRDPTQLSYYCGWLEPEILDHNRVRPRRSFTVVLDLNFRGRPKALPIDDLE